MALLQAWPGRGFWQGTPDGQPGSLAAMIKSMAGTPQPHPLEAVVSWFGNFTAAHGFAVNLVAVLALAAVGAGLCTAAVRGDARLARIAVIAGAVFCLADWVLVEDFGFFGGLGTDPNSMIPFTLLFTAGYLGLAPGPQPASVAEQARDAPDAAAADEPAGGASGSAGAPEPSGDASEPAGDGAARRPGSRAAARVRRGAAAGRRRDRGAWRDPGRGGADGRSPPANTNADPIIAQAIAGTSGQLDTPAPGFTLTSQDGRQVSLASLRGKVVLLTFLDPVCTTDCPLIAQEMRSADAMLGSQGERHGTGRRGRQPDLHLHRLHPGVHQPGKPRPGAQLAVPHRVAEPAHGRLAPLRDRGREPARRGDGRAQRPRLRDQRRRHRCSRRSATTPAPARRRRTRRSPASWPAPCCRRWASS